MLHSEPQDENKPAEIKINESRTIALVDAKAGGSLSGVSEKRISIDKYNLEQNEDYVKFLKEREDLLAGSPTIAFHFAEPLDEKAYQNAKKNSNNPSRLDEIQAEIRRIIQNYLYIEKKPKLRYVVDVFKDDKQLAVYLIQRAILFKSVGDKVKFNPATQEAIDKEQENLFIQKLDEQQKFKYFELQKKIQVFVNDPTRINHARNVVNQFTASGLILSELGTVLVRDIVTVPQNCLFMQDGYLITASKIETDFNEFLANKVENYIKHELKENPKTVMSPEFWKIHRRPTFKDLKLTADETRNLGRLFAYFLLLGCNDGFNNINASNAGICGKGLILVDQGNLGIEGVGGGMSAQNYRSILEGKIVPFTTEADKLTSDHHIFPYDEIIIPVLTRQLIPDLWDLTSSDSSELRLAMREGFSEVSKVALATLKAAGDHFPEDVKKSIQKSLSTSIAEKDRSEVVNLLPHGFFHLRKAQLDQNDYTCANVLAGRIKSLADIDQRLQKGEPLDQIAQENFKVIMKKFKKYEKGSLRLFDSRDILEDRAQQDQASSKLKLKF